MNNQKIDSQLNLALDLTDEELANSHDLDDGYQVEDSVWQLIVRHTGDLRRVRELSQYVVELLSGYAILGVRKEYIDAVARLEEIIYIEKPKRLNFEVMDGIRVSCINQVQTEPTNLHGKGCIVCVVDSGIDVFNEVFKDENGRTRILKLWDQTVQSDEFLPPDGYISGALFNNEDIDGADGSFPSFDRSGHGTAVASIACGNFARNKSNNPANDRGVATRSDIIAVKLGKPEENSFPTTGELMQAVDFCVRQGLEYGRPIAINISFGNNYGAHDGTSLLSTYLDVVSNIGRNVIVVGTGNEGAAGVHSEIMLKYDEDVISEFAIGDFEPSLNLQIWKMYGDIADIAIESPSGNVVSLQRVPGANRYSLGQVTLLVYVGEPNPYSTNQEIYIEFIPTNGMYLESGIWKINFRAFRIIDGRIDMWFPSDLVSVNTRFLIPTADTTLTIPSATRNVISVGGYDPLNFAYADFSGRGFTRVIGQIKPDIVAPAVNIVCAAVGGGTIVRTGTSFATPFVTGAAALMMEWGIVNGNDRYLYGEKVKSYMISGAKRLPGYERWPNERLGWGALCLKDSLPEI